MCHFSRTPRLRFFHFDSIFNFFTSAINVGYQLWWCIAVRRLRLSRAPHVSTDFESEADQDTSGAHPQQPYTTQIMSATVAGNNACVEVLFEATLRQPRADPLEFGP